MPRLALRRTEWKIEVDSGHEDLRALQDVELATLHYSGLPVRFPCQVWRATPGRYAEYEKMMLLTTGENLKGRRPRRLTRHIHHQHTQPPSSAKRQPCGLVAASQWRLDIHVGVRPLWQRPRRSIHHAGGDLGGGTDEDQLSAC